MNNSFFDFKLFHLNDSAAKPITLHGHGQKGLLIIFEAPEEALTELTDFLAKVLKAIHLDLDQDTVFLNRKPGEPLKIIEILEKSNAKQVLIFGVPTADLGIRFALAPYRNVSHQGTWFLGADGLGAIFAERQAGGKKMSGQLWQAIQQFEL